MLSTRDENNEERWNKKGETSEIPTEWRGEILSALSTIIDPDLNRDIVTLGFVKNLALDENTRTVSFDVELTTPACPVKDLFARQCEEAVRSFPWIQKADVTMTAQETAMAGAPAGLAQVGAIIAVSSCKGGVGKSTTAVNLAYALQSLGATVGIFDADVYGPSLPTMIAPDDDNVRFVGRQIAPLRRNGVRLMSFGYVNEGAAVMRGPMVSQLLDQFLSMTHWGSLDYLILDMPPGTGDIQLTLSQRLNITAAVIVTTPQELSFVDVQRGIDMFDSVNVPCVAVVENMAYWEPPDDQAAEASHIDYHRLREAFIRKLLQHQLQFKGLFDNQDSIQIMAEDLVQIVQQQQHQSKHKNQTLSKKRVQIFGSGHKKRLSQQWGIQHTFSVPLLQKISEQGDSGTPFILSSPDSPQAEIYKDLASSVVSEVAKIKHSSSSTRPSISFHQHRNTIQINGKSVLQPAQLRRECKCAACVEELTGRKILQPFMVPESVKPINIAPCGNYAVSVDWSDGHRSLYPYRQIMELVGGSESVAEENDTVLEKVAQ